MDIILLCSDRVAVQWTFFCPVRVELYADRNYFVVFGSICGLVDFIFRSVGVRIDISWN